MKTRKQLQLEIEMLCRKMDTLEKQLEDAEYKVYELTKAVYAKDVEIDIMQSTLHAMKNTSSEYLLNDIVNYHPLPSDYIHSTYDDALFADAYATSQENYE